MTGDTRRARARPDVPVRPDDAPRRTRRRAATRYRVAVGLSFALWILALVLPLRAELRQPVAPQDEGLLLVYPSLMLHGAIPNHTFLSAYGAASYWPIAAAFALLGHSVVVERGVALGYWVVLSGSLLVLVARRRGLIAGALAATVCVYVLAGPVTLIAYAWVGALALGALGLALLDRAEARDRPSGALNVAAGLCFGLAVSYRLEFALAVVLVGALVLVVDRRRAAWVLPGVALGLLPVLVNVARAGPAAVARGQVLWPVFLAGPGRHLPLGTLPGGAKAVLGASVLVAVALTALGAVSLRRGGSLIPLAVGLFDLALLPQSFQRADGVHVAFVACFVIPSILLAPLPARLRLARPTLLAGAAAALALVLVSPLAFGSFRARVASSLGVGADPQYAVSNGGRMVAVGSAAQARSLHRLLATLDARARPGQRVFIGPDDLRRAIYNDTYLYFLVPDLTPGSFYLEMDPGVANRASSGLPADLRRDDWLILTNAYDGWREPNASVHDGPDTANRVVRADFRPVGTWGSWSLMERRSGP